MKTFLNEKPFAELHRIAHEIRTHEQRVSAVFVLAFSDQEVGRYSWLDAVHVAREAILFGFEDYEAWIREETADSIPVSKPKKS